MQLSGLPAELFREVLYKLDPASFYACLQTSRLFREHALSSTDLLITHILRVPCPWTEASLRASPAQRLLRCFRRAAVKHLNHGCWMTDMHIWAAPSDIDRRNSLITQLEWNEYRGPRYEKVFVQVQRDAATIHIYYIGHHDAHCAAVCLKYIISPDLVSVSLPKKDGDLAQCQVLKVATMPSRVVGSNQAYASTPRIAVLYCGKCSPSELSPAWRRLLIFRLDEEFGPIVAEKCEVEIRKGERVVAMALNGDGEPIILYRKYAPYDWQFRLAVLRVDLDTALEVNAYQRT
ncbi:hypothetical protein K491DRAFT_470703 [Lophiostoma macrostomum CBS 122681]|uniref:F-box domain-containing protein n=1 Tax=Lophiostoma macrostomum CBS 122681 TaxID=1314788 RepID=A0A6A6T6R5_9PLEO|nr:hypothetical protein K491DRAFT_470703 [Lophiostoma macrostomum CBS 122681]